MQPVNDFSPRFFERQVAEIAADLIGASLFVNGVGGMIIETEAYSPMDPASHSFRGKTPTNSAMYGPIGSTYVYRSYGIHFCFNIVCEPGNAVLIRALEPLYGIDRMVESRGTSELKLLCSGPGRLTRALGISLEHTGQDILSPPFRLIPRSGNRAVSVGTRIGISKGRDLPWRFGLQGSPYISRPFRDHKQ